MNQRQASTTPTNERDLWETPEWMVDWLYEKFKFTVDLAATEDNAKFPFYLGDGTSSLELPWHLIASRGFCNPPYSNIKPWLAKGYEEAKKGFLSFFIVPTPNGEKAYEECVFGKASEIIFINGRVAFCRPDGTEVKGNTRGSCVVVYDPDYLGNTALRWVNRDALIKQHKESQCSK